MLLRICHFEDRHVADLEPLSLTRPVFDLLCGCGPLADKQARYFRPADGSSPPQERGALVRGAVAPLLRVGRACDWHVNDLDWLRRGPVVLVNGRWLPPAPSAMVRVPDAPCVGLVDDEVAYVILEAGLLPHGSFDLEKYLESWRATLPTQPAGGRVVRFLWELVEANGGQIALDAWLTDPETPRRTTDLPALVGREDRLRVDPSARVEPYVVADTTGGPVIIDRGAVITAFTRLEGPCYVGPGTHVLGAKVRAGTSFGPQCRIGGEVEACIVQGYSNKYHDGFLGHAYLGEWINLGAGTSNSDLRNDYGEVRVRVNGRLVPTGRTKIGCYLGDHTKAGLGTLLNTGTNAGAFCNLLPAAGLLPRHVPSFCDLRDGAARERADVESLLRDADKVMRRRGQSLGEGERRLYRLLWEQTADERRRVIGDGDVRLLRKSA